jgi:hypothetical protein
MEKNNSGEDSRVGSIGSALVLQSAADGHFRCFTVLIDGKPTGTIYRGYSERYPLAPGDHDLVVHTGAWNRSRWINYWFCNGHYSRHISFVVKADADCEATCGSNPLKSKKTFLVGTSIGLNLLELESEIQKALFPQHRFWGGNPLDAFIVFLLVQLSFYFGRIIVYWPDGLVWCKFK